LWPQGHVPTRLHHRLFLHASKPIWRGADAIIGVSPECERQVRTLVPDLSTPIHQVRVQYRSGHLDEIGEPPDAGPFRLFFAGRLDENKGVMELVDLAEELEAREPGRFTWELAGSGPAEDQLRCAIARAELESSVTLLGQLDRETMPAAFARAHAVIVPTNRGFTEGLNRVAVEGVLAGRPVITSRLSNAVDVLGPAIAEVPPGDPGALRDTILRLAHDPVSYREHRRACDDVTDQFYDRSLSWGAALSRILDSIYGARPASLSTRSG
ncbi:MAG: glycosyltransferase family 4 protein, partial [Planctomycetes bacterium]|nr:glycosyltransferase family 4 protein [Planctomycetota bacterium]